MNKKCIDIQIKSALLLTACLFSQLSNSMQQRVQQQTQIYQQQKKLLDKQRDNKKKIVNDSKDHNAAIQPKVDNLAGQPKIDNQSTLPNISEIKQKLTDAKAELSAIKNDLKETLNKNQPACPPISKPKPQITSPTQATQTDNIVQTELNQTVKSTNVIKSKSVPRLREHKRICPFCFEPSINCLHDQERLKNGEIVPCACWDCYSKDSRRNW